MPGNTRNQDKTSTAKIDDIVKTLASVATPGMKPKDLIAAVKEKHPDVSKKEIVRAAFYSLTDGNGVDAEKARDLHAFALSERASDADEAPAAKRPLKSKRKTAAKAGAKLGHPTAH